MNLSCGIVGLPNVGKSTLFNALMSRQIADASNYPFCTIEPNVGIVEVPDERLAVLAKICNSQKIVPAVVKFVDIAGLVAGASKGEGLGNQFLAHIREVDLIIHLIRAFKNEDVIRAGSKDPKSDCETVKTELILADLQTIEKVKSHPPSHKATGGTPRSSTPSKAKWSEMGQNSKPDEGGHRSRALDKLFVGLNSGMEAIKVELTDEEGEQIRELNLLTMKPSLIILNVSENELGSLERVRDDYIKGYPAEDIIPISALVESELSILSEPEKKEYLQSLGLEKSGLERLIKRAYEKLNLISFLTAGEKEARAWTIVRGAKAPQAAGVIHSDFEKSFIKAQVTSYDDFVRENGWKGVKEKGLVRFEGKDYLLQDGEVVEFMVGV